MKDRTKRVVVAAAAVTALAAGGAAIAMASGVGDDDGTERPISGPALDRASAAALAHTGGGVVTATEAGDEEGAYEVEVRRADGSQVDVHLDRNFDVLNKVSDDESESGQDDD